MANPQSAGQPVFSVILATRFCKVYLGMKNLVPEVNIIGMLVCLDLLAHFVDRFCQFIHLMLMNMFVSNNFFFFGFVHKYHKELLQS